MKTVKITGLIVFAILFLFSNRIIGQTDASQFERTQQEIIKLINLPNPTFNSKAIQKQKDEAFDAKRMTSAVIENSNGEAYVIENETHNGVRYNEKTMEVISVWANKHKLK